MTSFSLYLFGKKLSKLNQTQESIETLALWTLHYRKHAKVIVQHWADEFITVSEEQKVAFLFLANEIVKTTKKKSQDFRNEFKKVLPRIFEHIGETSTNWTLVNQTHRILDIWRGRRFFERSDIDYFWTCLSNLASAKPPNGKDSGAQSDEPYNVQKVFLTLNAPNPDELIEALESQHCYPSADEAMRSKIAAFPKELFETKTICDLKDSVEAADYAKELGKAGKMVESYNKDLELEVEERKKFNDMLLGYEEAELERIALIEQKLNEIENDLADKANLRKKLQRHRESLPDIENLSMIPELPPLPSAQDLFKKQQKK